MNLLFNWPIMKFGMFYVSSTLASLCYRRPAVLWAYFLVPEGLHQPDRLLHREREGEMGSCVDLRHLDFLVAEIPLPLCIPTNLILSEDVRN